MTDYLRLQDEQPNSDREEPLNSTFMPSSSSLIRERAYCDKENMFGGRALPPRIELPSLSSFGSVGRQLLSYDCDTNNLSRDSLLSLQLVGENLIVKPKMYECYGINKEEESFKSPKNEEFE